MQHHAPHAAAPYRTFAALAALLAAGLSLPADQPVPLRHGPAPLRPGPAPPGALVMLRTSATDAAGGTVTETITSAYRTGR